MPTEPITICLPFVVYIRRWNTDLTFTNVVMFEVWDNGFIWYTQSSYTFPSPLARFELNTMKTTGSYNAGELKGASSHSWSDEPGLHGDYNQNLTVSPYYPNYTTTTSETFTSSGSWYAYKYNYDAIAALGPQNTFIPYTGYLLDLLRSVGSLLLASGTVVSTNWHYDSSSTTWPDDSLQIVSYNFT